MISFCFVGPAEIEEANDGGLQKISYHFWKKYIFRYIFWAQKDYIANMLNAKFIYYYYFVFVKGKEKWK